MSEWASTLKSTQKDLAQRLGYVDVGICRHAIKTLLYKFYLIIIKKSYLIQESLYLAHISPVLSVLKEPSTL